MSRKRPSPKFSNRRFGPKLATKTSASPSLSMSPVATPHAVLGRLDAGCVGDILETQDAAGARVPEQTIVRHAFGAVDQRPTLDEPDVQPPIAVEVQNADAGTDRLHDPARAGHAVDVLEVDAGLLRDLGKSGLRESSPCRKRPTTPPRTRGNVDSLPRRPADISNAASGRWLKVGSDAPSETCYGTFQPCPRKPHRPEVEVSPSSPNLPAGAVYGLHCVIES